MKNYKALNVQFQKKSLLERVKYAYFDDDFWLLLTKEATRASLRNYIVETKLTNNGSGIKEIIHKMSCYLLLK